MHGLAPGAYRLRLELDGFRSVTREGIRLATGETVRLDLQLEVGGRPMPSRSRPTPRCCGARPPALGQVIDNRKIVALPLNGRSFITLAGPGARRGAAARVAAAAHQRRTATHQRIPVRRDFGAAARARPGGVLSQRRRHSGIQDRDQQPAGRVRPLQRRRRQPDHQGGQQHVSRHRVRVLPERGAERAELLRLDQPGQAAVQAQPVRRRHRRPDSAGSRRSSSPTTRDSGRRLAERSFRPCPPPLQRQGVFTEAIGGRVPAIYDPATTVPLAPAASLAVRSPGNTIPVARMDAVALELLQRYPLADRRGHGQQLPPRGQRDRGSGSVQRAHRPSLRRPTTTRCSAGSHGLAKRSFRSRRCQRAAV